MRLLLDTHTFLWSYSDIGKIPHLAKERIEEPDNEVFVSSISFWEISLKISIGKLKPKGRHPSELVEVARSLGMIPIPLTPQESATYGDLTESTHFDPFDRMLIWQAICRGLTLVSGDREFRRFEKDGLRILWG